MERAPAVSGDEEPTGEQVVTAAARIVSARYGIGLDEAAHALHFEACLVGRSLAGIAAMTVASRSASGPDEPSVHRPAPVRPDPGVNRG